LKLSSAASRPVVNGERRSEVKTNGDLGLTVYYLPREGSPVIADRRSSRLAEAVSWEQLREDSALSNRNFDSTTAGVCVTVKHGLRGGRTRCEVRSPRHTGPRRIITASAFWHVPPAASGAAAASIETAADKPSRNRSESAYRPKSIWGCWSVAEPTHGGAAKMSAECPITRNLVDAFGTMVLSYAAGDWTPSGPD